MANPQIIIHTTVEESPAICAWLDAVAKKFPRYSGMFVRLAITHYKRTGTHLNLATLPVIDETFQFEKDKYCIAFSVDDEILSWKEDVKKSKVKIRLALLDILNESLTIDASITSPKLSSYGSLVTIPNDKNTPKEVTFTPDKPTPGPIIHQEVISESVVLPQSEIKNNVREIIKEEKDSTFKRSKGAAASISSKTAKIFR